MKAKRPTTTAEYIGVAPSESRAHLRKLHAILKSVAPNAQEMIKWGNPFFVEPRFLFAFSAHKAHLSFAPGPETLESFRGELKQYQTTTNFLKIRYNQPVPEQLIRKMAEHRFKTVSEREDDNFW